MKNIKKQIAQKNKIRRWHELTQVRGSEKRNERKFKLMSSEIKNEKAGEKNTDTKSLAKEGLTIG